MGGWNARKLKEMHNDEEHTIVTLADEKKRKRWKIEERCQTHRRWMSEFSYV
jgi:tRNA(Ile)-lysidine synthase TilS/MesJ